MADCRPFFADCRLSFDNPKSGNDNIIEEANILEQHPDTKDSANAEIHSDAGFVAATGGKGYAFFGTKDEAMDFYRSYLPEHNDELVRKGVISAMLRPSICIYDENYGLVTIPVAEFLKSPDNLYYKETPDNPSKAVTMLCGKNNIPYSVVCKMNRLGLLDCARHYYFTGTDEELRKHNQFIIDYFYYQHQ